MNATTTPQAADIVNLSDCAGLARAALDDNAWSYFSGGAADEHTDSHTCTANGHTNEHARAANGHANSHNNTNRDYVDAFAHACY